MTEHSPCDLDTEAPLRPPSQARAVVPTPMNGTSMNRDSRFSARAAEMESFGTKGLPLVPPILEESPTARQPEVGEHLIPRGLFRIIPGLVLSEACIGCEHAASKVVWRGRKGSPPC